jgi:hypothetical protein
MFWGTLEFHNLIIIIKQTNPLQQTQTERGRARTRFFSDKTPTSDCCCLFVSQPGSKADPFVLFVAFSNDLCGILAFVK